MPPTVTLTSKIQMCRDHSFGEWKNIFAFAAIKTDGSVVTWGDSANGGSSGAVAGQLNGTIDVVQIYSSGDWDAGAFAALRSDGSVITWGAASRGGDSQAVVNEINGTIDVCQIFSTGYAFAALRYDGSVITWGGTNFDTNAGGVSSAVADLLDGSIPVIAISSTRNAFAALRNDGSVVTWGNPWLGGGDSSAVASELAGTIDVTQIYSNSAGFAALRNDGSVVAWGVNGSSVAMQLLDGTIDVLQIFATDSSFAALRSDGSVVTWGNPDWGGDSRAVSTKLDGTIDVTSIVSTWNAFAAIRNDGSVVTWGDSSEGGNSSSVGDKINGTIDVVQIVTTGSAFAALRSDGSVVTWGHAGAGGDNLGVAEQLNGTIDVVKICSTDRAFAALRTDGSVIAWGDGDYGGDTNSVWSRINGTVDVTQLFSTDKAFAALRTDGSIVTWGDIAHGGSSSAVTSLLTSGVVSVDNIYTEDVVNYGTDLTAPSILYCSPLDGATSVSPISNLMVTFTEAIQRGSGNIVLKTATDVVVETFDVATSNRLRILDNTLLIDPANTLVETTNYFLAFTAGSVKDLAGNSFAGISTYDFITGTNDTTSPNVTAFSPMDGAYNVSSTSNITLTFNEAIQRGSGNIVLKTADGAVVEIFAAATSSRLSISGNTLTIDPTNNLAGSTHYFLAISAGAVKDLNGNSFAENGLYDFTTVDTPPSVTAFNPLDGTTDVPVTANIILTFSESIQRGSGNIVLKNAAGTVVETFDATSSNRLTILGNTLTIDPTYSLAGDTQYFLTVPFGSIKDLSGNSYAGSSSYDFTTVETEPPHLSNPNPADGATGVVVTANIVCTFSENIQRGVGSILLKTADGTTVESFDAATDSRLSISGATLTINPTNPLNHNTHYYVNFETGTIKDLVGNNYYGTTTYGFTTESDTTAPLLDGSKSPTLASVSSSGSMPINGSTAGSTPVTALIDASGPLNNFSDANGDLPGIAITGVTDDATLYFSTNNGTTWEAIGPVSATSARVLYADPGTLLFIQPKSGYVGSIDTALSFKAWDRAGGYDNGQPGVNTEAEVIQPSVAGICFSNGYYAYDVAVSGNYAFVLTGSMLQIFDISSSASPVLAGSYYDTLGRFDGVTVSGSYAYLAASYNGLQIMNISNPAHPVLVGAYDDTNGYIYARDLSVSGSYAYVVIGESGLETGSLRIMNISNPAHPVLVGTCDTPGSAYSVTVSGSYAYVADYRSGLEIIDISNPANPVLVGNYDTRGQAQGVTVNGSYAYVADGDAGLEIIDISNPTNPILLGSCDTNGFAYDISLSGRYAYVADFLSGLEIIDISNPVQPVLVGTYDTLGRAYDVTVSGNYAYVADYSTGMQIVDISAIHVFSSNTDTVSVTVKETDNTVPDGSTIRGTPDGDRLRGTNKDDVLEGLDGDDTLLGYAGNDTLDGGAGADTMLGGLGNDTYYVDDAGDVVTETRLRRDTGVDTVFARIDWTLGGNCENLTLIGTAQRATGNRLRNILIGNDEDNILDGQAGADIMRGGLGNDTYIVDNLADLTIETGLDLLEIDTLLTSVNRTLGANLENLTLTGTRAINGAGNSLDNILTGNDAANKLRGAGGNDTLTGGHGQDMFYFDTPLDAATNDDTITDFTVGEDLLRLDRSIFTNLTAGFLNPEQFLASSTGHAMDGNDYLLYNTNTGDLLYDGDGSDAGAAVTFATLNNAPGLTAASCIVVG